MHVGQPLYLKFHPEVHGTVPKIEADRFRVTWPADGQRSRNNPRLRIWYPRSALSTGLMPGLPR